MLSTFTTKHGSLIIPTANIRRIEDIEQSHGPGEPATIECIVMYAVTETDTHFAFVTGTARENLERLQREELEMIAKVERAERRMDTGLPPLPIVRGGKVRG